MSQTVTTPRVPGPTEAAPHLIARWAGGLAIAHVVVMLGGFALEGVASVGHGTAPDKVTATFAGLAISRTLLAGYVEAMAFLILVPAVLLIARAVAARTEVGRIGTQAFVVLGAAYIASTLAVGFPPGAAAVYAAHHGVDAGAIAMVNDIRNYGFVLQVALSLAMALALGIACLAERVHVRWMGWVSAVVGAVGLVVTPFEHNATSAVWLVWWVGTGLVLLRTRPAKPIVRS